MRAIHELLSMAELFKTNNELKKMNILYTKTLPFVAEIFHCKKKGSLLFQQTCEPAYCVTTRRLNNESLANDLGPVVQSIVSLTSSLRGLLVKCFTTL